MVLLIVDRREMGLYEDGKVGGLLGFRIGMTELFSIWRGCRYVTRIC